jgi:hypothetical protein
MIKFALVCDKGHAFESWFRSGDDYETQARRGFVECPSCGSGKVGKAIMSPAIARRDRGRTAPMEPVEAPQADAVAVPVPAAPPQPMALLDERQKQLQAMVREIHAKISATTTDVGARFPEEARRMHEGEIPDAPIRGQATLEEARELWEDGIPVMPIPLLPEDRN